MALVRPPEFLRWSTDESNDTEPLEAKKDTGLTVDEEPSSAEANFLWRIAGEFQEWLRQRMDDGLITEGGVEDFKIQAPDAATIGGTLTLKGGDSGDASSISGSVTITSGLPGATGPSGNITITTEDTIDGSDPGGVTIKPGKPGIDSASTGFASVSGGDATGTDRNGGVVVIEPGDGTGNGGGNVVLRGVTSGQGAGATVRGPANFLEINGLKNKLEASRPFRLTPQAERASAFQDAGDLYCDSGRVDQLRVLTPFDWSSLVGQIVSSQGSVESNYSAEQDLDGGILTIPSGEIYDGMILRVDAVVRIANISGVSTAFTDLKMLIGGLLISDLQPALQTLPGDQTMARLFGTIRFSAGGASAFFVSDMRSESYNATLDANTVVSVGVVGEQRFLYGLGTSKVDNTSDVDLVLRNLFGAADDDFSTQVLAFSVSFA